MRQANGIRERSHQPPAPFLSKLVRKNLDSSMAVLGGAVCAQGSEMHAVWDEVMAVRKRDRLRGKRRGKVTVTLEQSEFDKLKREARERNISRSRLVFAALHYWWTNHKGTHLWLQVHFNQIMRRRAHLVGLLVLVLGVLPAEGRAVGPSASTC